MCDNQDTLGPHKHAFYDKITHHRIIPLISSRYIIASILCPMTTVIKAHNQPAKYSYTNCYNKQQVISLLLGIKICIPLHQV
jgi:hypothetical protein